TRSCPVRAVTTVERIPYRRSRFRRWHPPRPQRRVRPGRMVFIFKSTREGAKNHGSLSGQADRTDRSSEKNHCPLSFRKGGSDFGTTGETGFPICSSNRADAVGKSF